MITGFRAFVLLLGPPRTLGEAIHIASDVLTWNQIMAPRRGTAHAGGVADGPGGLHDNVQVSPR